MARSPFRFLPATLAFGGLLAAACSTKSDPNAFPPSAAGSSAKGGSTGKGKAGESAGGNGAGNASGGSEDIPPVGGAAGGGVMIGGAGGDTGGGGAAQCGADSVVATPVPLDLFIMLDQSGSMNEIAEGATSKWKTVGLALGTFMTDKRSAGIGAGLQYFPSQDTFPLTCSSDAACKGKGTCSFPKSCDKLSKDGIRYACADDESCLNSGVPNSKCIERTTDAKECVDTVCTVADYSSPDVPITEIPGAIDLFQKSLAKHAPKGGTPTGPALQGALEYATGWANEHPDHKVAVVLVTDGLPTQCAPVGKAGIADTALASRPLVDTYVIGVFSKDADLALVNDNLNTIAQAGAERDAFLITTGGSSGKDFADAMFAIRTSALPCDFAIPEPTGGKAADYGKVNVNLTDADGNTTPVLYTPTVEGCDPEAGGWYYDADPKAGGKPTQVKLCAASCETYRTGVGSSLATVFGCETIILPPPK